LKLETQKKNSSIGAYSFEAGSREPGQLLISLEVEDRMDSIRDAQLKTGDSG